MNDLFRGIGLTRVPGPSLRSVRQMRNLRAALREINRRPVGIDGIRFEAFTDPFGYVRWDPTLLNYLGLEPLQTLQESLALAYQWIPDATIAFRVEDRVVERGTVSNRVVERAFARKLNSSLDPFLSESSLGYRPGRSPELAILQVRACVRDGFRWALKTDIKQFFPNIKLRILKSQLKDSLRDKPLRDALMVLIQPVACPTPAAKRLIDETNLNRGLPQGSGVSPFLSNLYLHRFDQACSDLRYFRYADDLLVLGRTAEEVVDAREIIQKRVVQLGLRLNVEKTVIRDLYREPVVFLGYEIRGGNIYPPEKSILRFRQKLKFRGQEARRALMKSFVGRYSVGPVRKLFRRLDRDLRRLYPPGCTLTGLLDHTREATATGTRQRQRTGPAPTTTGASTTMRLRHSQGQGRSDCNRESPSGQAPAVAAAGGSYSCEELPLAQRESCSVRRKPSVRDKKYLEFLHSRPCSFCANRQTEPHYLFKCLRGISEAGMAQKGSGFLAIPTCRRCNRKLHDGILVPDRAQALEFIIVNLVCYLDRQRTQRRLAKKDSRGKPFAAPAVRRPRMRDEKYLHFIRSRPCSFCADPRTEPHHYFKYLRGVSDAGVAEKGSDYLSIPVNRRCHKKLHDGQLRPDRAEALELIVINLICYLDANREKRNLNLRASDKVIIENSKPMDYAALGRRGGLVQSERKTIAVRENGRLGGQPRKTKAANLNGGIRVERQLATLPSTAQATGKRREPE